MEVNKDFQEFLSFKAFKQVIRTSIAAGFLGSDLEDDRKQDLKEELMYIMFQQFLRSQAIEKE